MPRFRSHRWFIEDLLQFSDKLQDLNFGAEGSVEKIGRDGSVKVTVVAWLGLAQAAHSTPI
jgi:hypothetical protein